MSYECIVLEGRRVVVIAAPAIVICDRNNKMPSSNKATMMNEFIQSASILDPIHSVKQTSVEILVNK